MAASRRVAVTDARARTRVGRLAPLAMAALGVAVAGCRSLDRFDTSGPAAYCGSIVGGPLFQEGFVPNGAPPSLSLHLELDTNKLTSRPGSLTSNDVDDGLCSATSGALFQQAPLRAIEEIFHDALSQIDLGEGHQHDFFAWVDSSCQGTMLAVVSLLTNGAVEVRLLKPAAEPPKDAGPDKQPGFALFYLQRSDEGCPF